MIIPPLVHRVRQAEAEADERLQHQAHPGHGREALEGVSPLLARTVELVAAAEIGAVFALSTPLNLNPHHGLS